MQPLEATQIFNSEAGGLYACKTKFGWCIGGPTGQENDNRSLKCSKIAVKEVFSDNVLNHHFEFENEIKDVGIEHIFKKIYNQELNEGFFTPSRDKEIKSTFFA